MLFFLASHKKNNKNRQLIYNENEQQQQQQQTVYKRNKEIDRMLKCRKIYLISIFIAIHLNRVENYKQYICFKPCNTL